MSLSITLLRLVRAPAGLTAVSNILAAATIASNGQLTWSIVWLLLASSCLYFSGMALNDCFDVNDDQIHRPERPIPSGAIRLIYAWRFAFSLMVLGVLFAFVYSLSSGVISLVLATFIVLYNGYIKQGLVGSMCMAACRYTNWLLGASFMVLTITSWFIAIPIFCYIIGLTFLSKQEEHGKDKTAVLVCALMILFTAFSVIFLIEQHYYLDQFEVLVAYSLLFIWLALMIIKLAQIFRAFTPQNIQRFIGWMVIGVIPLDALLVAAFGEYQMSLIILLLLPICRRLNRFLTVT